MKKSWRYLLGAVPAVLAAALLLPSTNQGWQSVCACVSPKVNFELFVRDNGKTEITDAAIAAAFATHFPIGTPAADIEARMVTQKQACRAEPGRKLTCSYWLETNESLAQERGQEIAFALTAEGLVAGRPTVRPVTRALARGS